MARIWLVRHGEAAAGWGDDPDPGLSEHGAAQADAVASRLAGTIGDPVPVLTSPLRRCVETASPLASRWGVEPVVEPAVGEIVPPAGRAELADRPVWLREVMSSSWEDLPDSDRAWRRSVLGRLAAIDADTVVFTHFVLINAAVGAAAGDDRVVVFRPANCSVTELHLVGGRLQVARLGDEMGTGAPAGTLDSS